MPDDLPGLIVDNTIYINSRLPFMESIAIIAEEIGHYKTNVKYNLVDYSNPFNFKQEQKARRWSYSKLVPVNRLKKFIENKDTVLRHEIAEEFDVPEKIIEEAISMYRISGQL